MKDYSIFASRGPEILKQRVKGETVFIAHDYWGNDQAKRRDYRLNFEDAFKKDFHMVFPDIEGKPGHLLSTICFLILNSSVGIYDVTTLNVNVLIELGIAIGLNRPLLVIAKSDVKLLDFLDELNPFRYDSLTRLAKNIRDTVTICLDKTKDVPLNYCMCCKEPCESRRNNEMHEDEYTLVGLDEHIDEALHWSTIQVVEDFALVPSSQAAGNTSLCKWMTQLRHSRLALFHFNNLDDKNRAMIGVQLGMAVGLGIPWTLILREGHHAPADLNGIFMNYMANLDADYRLQLQNSVRALLKSRNMNSGVFTKLLDTQVSTEEDTPNLVMESTTVTSESAEERIQVFSFKGDMIELPVGSTPIDFAYRIHTEIGHRCRGAKVNKVLVNLNSRLKANDSIEIITSERGGPSLDWLNPDFGYVQTTRARDAIRTWFRRQDRERVIASGREVLEHELKRLGVEHMSFENVSQIFGYNDLEDFLTVVGAGDIKGSQIADKILEAERPDQQKSLVEESLEAQYTVPSQIQVETNGININGLGGMLVTLGQCCNPMPGDPIIGYVTRGRGVTVHRADCSKLKSQSEPERLVELSWGSPPTDELYAVPVEIVAYDRDGLLRDISTIVANEKINMRKVAITTRQNVAIVQLTLEIANFHQLTRILNKFEHVQNVIEARRRKMT